MTAFTQEYLPLISDYLRVLSVRKDSLTSIYHSYRLLLASTKLHDRSYSSIFNSSIIAQEQCIPRVARAQHASHLQNFLRHDILHAFVCKLKHELYRIMEQNFTIASLLPFQLFIMVRNCGLYNNLYIKTP